MLSILIPEHNYDCRQLVKDLALQCQEADIAYELIVLDDFSSLFKEENRQIRKFANCSFIETHQNNGAARTRNVLTGMARYPFLLIVDCDAEVPDNQYVMRYLDVLGKADVIIGGLCYSQEKPSPDKMLRWKYGRERECIAIQARNKHPYQSFLSFQFLIRKEVMQQHLFEETVRDYGHEDTILGYELGRQGVSLLYIDNPLIHKGLDSNAIFLQKSLMATRKYLTNPIFQRKEIVEGIKLFRIFQRVKKYHLQTLVLRIFVLFRTNMQKNLYSADPLLSIFDFYRLGYLCLLDKIESGRVK